jgi:hypothetical protein
MTRGAHPGPFKPWNRPGSSPEAGACYAGVIQPRGLNTSARFGIQSYTLVADHSEYNLSSLTLAPTEIFDHKPQLSTNPTLDVRLATLSSP